MIFYFHLP